MAALVHPASSKRSAPHAAVKREDRTRCLQGIEVAITDNVPEIESVVDVTDHASGTNPYYEAAKK